MKILEGAAATAVPVRPASTTLIVRDGKAGLEVLMVRRSPTASFMPGAYVFPGGAVDAADETSVAASDEGAARLAERVGAISGVGARAGAHAVAALRESFEECGLWPGMSGLPPIAMAGLRARLHAGESMAQIASMISVPLATSALVPWSRWITPLGLPKRFDTLFFICRAPDGQVPSVDAAETTTLGWVLPPVALLEQSRGNFQMEFPTLRTVESLMRFAPGTVDDLLQHAASQKRVPLMQPRIGRDAQRQPTGLLLPGQPGFDEAG